PPAADTPPTHMFNDTAVDLLGTYTPPPVAGTGATTYDYNADRQFELATRPDTQQVDPAYDAATGRLSTLTVPGGVYTYSYVPSGSGAGHVSSVTTNVPR